ncbi:MoeB1 [Desulfamplus magnetovallimortis]|uniref:MoeB1 n=1 Tax=Desulfamplus magnetovallimortis TaxID=1246637 RepID=A0A1W1HBQ0_9BACT|nr:HesA/MoeB/ThiF family protein [Desulfamplus magnetovallimortis]SLM29808.1 MoeB1 [Desulfamplus magnetovallimortis]
MKKNKLIERYSRNFNTLTEQEQSLLLKAKVCIAGLGGLGGAVTEMLARVGVGYLTLVDGDIFEASNLNRQLFSTEATIGASKASVALQRVKAINSDVNVTIYETFLTHENCNKILNGNNLVVDCLDSINDRFMLQKAAQKAKIPLVSGAIAGTSGQVTTIYPDDSGFELIYGKTTDTRYSEKGIESLLGNLSYCALFIASIQASETLKVILNRGNTLRNRLFIADLMTNTFDIMTLQ